MFLLVQWSENKHYPFLHHCFPNLLHLENMHCYVWKWCFLGKYQWLNKTTRIIDLLGGPWAAITPQDCISSTVLYLGAYFYLFLDWILCNRVYKLSPISLWWPLLHRRDRWNLIMYGIQNITNSVDANV